MPMEHTACYADKAWHGPVEVVEHLPLARDTYRLRILCPPIAQRIVPGQFVMLRLAGCNDPLLGRPLALYDVACDGAGRRQMVDVVYLAVGKFTRKLAELGVQARLEAWGPLGNGFAAEPAEHLLMVAGGIGQTPFMALAREALGLMQFGDPPRRPFQSAKTTLCYGVRTADYLAGIDDFRRLGVDVRVSTDDGSQGHRGMVTDLIAPAVADGPQPCLMACCGPEKMMAAAAAEARRLQIPCRLSLESPMACGIGICFSCVAKIRDSSGKWDYRRTCIDGPVFDADDVELDCF